MWRLAAGALAVADFRFDHRIDITETSPVPGPAAFAGITFDELVQWMVQDASLDRCDR
jgi:D-alanine-D-alanine ligase